MVVVDVVGIGFGGAAFAGGDCDVDDALIRKGCWGGDFDGGAVYYVDIRERDIYVTEFDKDDVVEIGALDGYGIASFDGSVVGDDIGDCGGID